MAPDWPKVPQSELGIRCQYNDMICPQSKERLRRFRYPSAHPSCALGLAEAIYSIPAFFPAGDPHRACTCASAAGVHWLPVLRRCIQSLRQCADGALQRPQSRPPLSPVRGLVLPCATVRARSPKVQVLAEGELGSWRTFFWGGAGSKEAREGRSSPVPR